MNTDTIQLTARGLECPPEIRSYIIERVANALSRFAGRLTSVVIRLVDVNGPRGGVDKSCTITISLDGAQVIVESRAETAEAAVVTATRRVRKTVARQLERAGTRARGRQRNGSG